MLDQLQHLNGFQNYSCPLLCFCDTFLQFYLLPLNLKFLFLSCVIATFTTGKNPGILPTAGKHVQCLLEICQLKLGGFVLNWERFKRCGHSFCLLRCQTHLFALQSGEVRVDWPHRFFALGKNDDDATLIPMREFDMMHMKCTVSTYLCLDCLGCNTTATKTSLSKKQYT